MRATLRAYAESLRRTMLALAKAPWVILLPMAYGLLLGLTAAALAPLGMVGAVLLAFASTAVAASFLYVVDEMVSGGAIRPGELVASVRRHFWPIMNVLFVFWVAELLLAPLLTEHPNGSSILFALIAVLFVLLNATPEVIYQKRLQGGLATLAESIRFIQRYWIEWLIPNVAFGAALWFGLPKLLQLAAAGTSGARALGAQLALGLVEGLVLLPIMVFRGHLFRELDGGATRARALQYRP